MIDARVVDGKGRTIPGLTKEDFTLIVGGKPVEIDTFDATCPGGAADDRELAQQERIEEGGRGADTAIAGHAHPLDQDQGARAAEPADGGGGRVAIAADRADARKLLNRLGE